jgi:hypothetical protein
MKVILLSRDIAALVVAVPGLILCGTADLHQWMGFGPGSLKHFFEHF